jgi:teichuronic acid biosynthesis glycosyltransferase TuaG
MAKVSIITPCFNASKFIEVTYSSLKNQTFTEWEWVIVDDCSTDKSRDILLHLAKNDNRIKLSKNSKNSGAAITRNNSLNKATGEYLAFLDADDEWVPQKLENQLNFMIKNKIDFSYHDYWTVNPDGLKIKKQTCPTHITAKDLLKFNPFATSSVMIKSDLIEINSIRFKEHLLRRQDYLFWYTALIVSTKARCLHQELSYYRIFGSDSLSSNKKMMATIQWRLYRNEFKLGLVPSIYYFIHYAIHGLKKYFF